jgi:hypothetical protein
VCSCDSNRCPPTNAALKIWCVLLKASIRRCANHTPGNATTVTCSFAERENCAWVSKSPCVVKYTVVIGASLRDRSSRRNIVSIIRGLQSMQPPHSVLRASICALCNAIASPVTVTYVVCRSVMAMTVRPRPTNRRPSRVLPSRKDGIASRFNPEEQLTSKASRPRSPAVMDSAATRVSTYQQGNPVPPTLARQLRLLHWQQ